MVFWFGFLFTVCGRKGISLSIWRLFLEADIKKVFFLLHIRILCIHSDSLHSDCEGY